MMGISLAKSVRDLNFELGDLFSLLKVVMGSALFAA